LARLAAIAASMRLRIEGAMHSRRDGMACANDILVNATLDFMAEVVERVFAYVAPSLSFGLYAGAEAIFLYGLYMVFFGPHHGTF
jgi:hypothetical protein